MGAQVCQATAELFRALGHPVRIRVLELLQEGPRPAHELLREVGVEASSLSQQLFALRRSGIVSASRRGQNLVYQLSSSAVGELIDVAREATAVILPDVAGGAPARVAAHSL